MRFIHCADLHLGRQQFNLPARWQDFGNAFEYIVDYTISAKADCMLISGDLFHERSINASTLSQAGDILSKLKDKGIPVFAIEGNHDKALYKDKESWMQYLDKRGYITLLKPLQQENTIELSEYSQNKGCISFFKGVRIIGLGYLGVTTQERLKAIAAEIDRAEQPTILMLHAAVDKLMGQDLAGVSNRTFLEFEGKADYIALGHIHSKQQKGFLYNPGAPECVHIDEAGKQKGFFDVTITKDGVEAMFVPSKRRDVRNCVIDITNAKDEQAILSQTLSVLGGAKDAIVRITYTGQIQTGLVVDTISLCDAITLQTGCLYAEAMNMTNIPDTDLKSFKKEDLELKVITEMLESKGAAWGDIDNLAGFILGIKESILLGNDILDIADVIISAAEDGNVD